MKNYRLEKKYMPFGKKSFLKVSALLCVSLSLFACNKEKAPGQSLARVNKDEVTISQLNEEMQRLGPQQTINNKQVLDALIDKQLLIAQAEHEKLDRDPAIMQAIERAKGQILVQAYMQRKLASNAKPTAAEVSSFYEQNPDLFAHRKQYDMKQLMIDSAQLTQELSNFVQTAKNLEDVAAWLASKKIPFASGQLSRTSSDIPAEMNTALKVMAKGQLFSVKEGNRSLIVALLDTKDLPVTEAVAAPQIQQPCNLSATTP